MAIAGDIVRRKALAFLVEQAGFAGSATAEPEGEPSSDDEEE